MLFEMIQFYFYLFIFSTLTDLVLSILKCYFKIIYFFIIHVFYSF